LVSGTQTTLNHMLTEIRLDSLGIYPAAGWARDQLDPLGLTHDLGGNAGSAPATRLSRPGLTSDTRLTQQGLVTAWILSRRDLVDGAPEV
jgi:hypothetical protein